MVDMRRRRDIMDYGIIHYQDKNYVWAEVPYDNNFYILRDLRQYKQQKICHQFRRDELDLWLTEE